MKKVTILILISVLYFSGFGLQAQNSTNYSDLSWKKVVASMPEKWYASPEALMIADTIVKYQTIHGGWPKNVDFHSDFDRDELLFVQKSGIGATIDNGATILEIDYLAKVYANHPKKDYLKSFLKAMDYLFEAQYDNGGWPQFYPPRFGNRSSYADHITYNDYAMVRVMQFLKKVCNDDSQYLHMQLSNEIKEKARESFYRGVDCILKTQIIVDGKPTVWCAQHDAKTLKPAKARAYELESFSGQESVGNVEVLMSIPNPSQEVINSVVAAVNWFQNNKIDDIIVEIYTNENGKRDRRVVDAPGADPVWARFYDLDTVKPFFCDRDGIKKNTMAEVGLERRIGYAWYTQAPVRVLSVYDQWREKHGL